MGGEARQTALWHHLNGSHKGSVHTMFLDQIEPVGLTAYLLLALLRMRRADLQRAAARGTRRTG